MDPNSDSNKNHRRVFDFNLNFPPTPEDGNHGDEIPQGSPPAEPPPVEVVIDSAHHHHPEKAEDFGVGLENPERNSTPPREDVQAVDTSPIPMSKTGNGKRGIQGDKIEKRVKKGKMARKAAPGRKESTTDTENLGKKDGSSMENTPPHVREDKLIIAGIKNALEKAEKEAATAPEASGGNEPAVSAASPAVVMTRKSQRLTSAPYKYSNMVLLETLPSSP